MTKPSTAPKRWCSLCTARQAGSATLFAWRVLRPLYWFGLVECAEDGEDLEAACWRKSALFGRFLGFGTDLVRFEGSLP